VRQQGIAEREERIGRENRVGQGWVRWSRIGHIKGASLIDTPPKVDTTNENHG
jgi:hypothetical protein